MHLCIVSMEGNVQPSKQTIKCTSKNHDTVLQLRTNRHILPINMLIEKVGVYESGKSSTLHLHLVCWSQGLFFLCGTFDGLVKFAV